MINEVLAVTTFSKKETRFTNFSACVAGGFSSWSPVLAVSFCPRFGFEASFVCAAAPRLISCVKISESDCKRIAVYNQFCQYFVVVAGCRVWGCSYRLDRPSTYDQRNIFINFGSFLPTNLYSVIVLISSATPPYPPTVYPFVVCAR